MLNRLGNGSVNLFLADALSPCGGVVDSFEELLKGLLASLPCEGFLEELSLGGADRNHFVLVQPVPEQDLGSPALFRRKVTGFVDYAALRTGFLT